MQIKSWLKKCKEELLDLIYPKVCFGCNRRLLPSCEKYICTDCLQKIEKPANPFCLSCGKTIDRENETRCAGCAGVRYSFAKGYTASIYEGVIKEGIHFLKYNSCTHLGGTLGSIMSDFADENIPMKDIDVIIPIPLHWKRKRDRGFNQAEMLAEVLSKKTGVRLETGVLFRVHPVHTQVTLSRQKRFNNIEGAFTVKNREKVLGQHILLVDDVFTTGATFNECGKVLLNAGAKEVWVFSLTRGVLQK